MDNSRNGENNAGKDRRKRKAKPPCPQPLLGDEEKQCPIHDLTFGTRCDCAGIEMLRCHCKDHFKKIFVDEEVCTIATSQCGSFSSCCLDMSFVHFLIACPSIVPRLILRNSSGVKRLWSSTTTWHRSCARTPFCSLRRMPERRMDSSSLTMPVHLSSLPRPATARPARSWREQPRNPMTPSPSSWAVRGCEP